MGEPSDKPVRKNEPSRAYGLGHDHFGARVALQPFRQDPLLTDGSLPADQFEDRFESRNEIQDARRRNELRRDVRDRLAGLADNLMIVGIIGVVMSAFEIGATGFFASDATGCDVLTVAFFGGLGLLQVFVSTVIIIGSRRMKGLYDYRFASTAAVLSFLPVFSPACLFGLVFGIQAYRALNEESVRDAFR